MSANSATLGGKPTRGANRGRGGRSPSGPARAGPPAPLVPISLAKPEKSFEEKLFARFSVLNPDAVRVTRYRNGTEFGELLVEGAWVKEVDLLPRLLQKEKEVRAKLELARAPARLNRALTSLEEASEEELRILRMTQKEYNSFRAGQSSAPAPAAQAAGPSRQ